MNSFQVIQPSQLLTPFIKQYWFLTLNDVPQSSQRIIPFGNVALSFNRGERSYSSSENGLLPLSYITGQLTSYTNVTYSGNINLISIIFQPASARLFFNFPLSELNNKNIPIEALDDPQLTELEKYLAETYSNEACAKLIEKYLLKRLYEPERSGHSRLNAVIHSINHCENNIFGLAQAACLGYKQFNRIFNENIGIQPKDFLRIVRFQKAFHILQVQSQITLTKLAFECNYYDKSHLIREFKEFTGYTPRKLLSLCDPYCDYHSLFRSAFIDSPSIQPNIKNE